VKAHWENIEIPGGQSFRIIRWDRNLEEVESLGPEGEARQVGGEGTHWHYHAEMELTWFRKGKGTRFVGDGIDLFEAGEVVLLGSFLPHYWHLEGDSAGISIQWHFPRGHPFWAFPESACLGELLRAAGNGILIGGTAAQEVSGLMKAVVSKSGLGRLGALLALLERLSGKEEPESTVISSKPFALAEKSVYRHPMENAMRHVIANFREEVRLETLLELTSLSRATFSRQFRIHAGKSFSEFLLQLRIETACRELLETDRTVTEIAYACGFGQISFFNRSFRRGMGCTPMEFRKR